MPGVEENVDVPFEGDNEDFAADRSDAPFECPLIGENVGGWGPSTLPSQFADIPYQPFSKGDRIGKVTDWSGNNPNDRRQNQNFNQFGAGGTAFTYFHGDDESSFSMVSNVQAKPKQYGRKFVNYRRGGGRGGRGGRGGGRGGHQQQQSQMKSLAGRAQQKRRLGNAARTAQNRYSTFQQRREQKIRAPSVPIDETWELLETIEFTRFADLAFDPEAPSDLEMCGQLEFYDKNYDNVRTKMTKPLKQFQRQFHNVTTFDDPIIEKIARSGVGNVFATDLLMSTIMSCTRSTYSWDIIATRIGDKLFLDKREDSSLDYLDVNETAPDAPTDDAENKINTAKSLAIEATYINYNFSQQVLKNNNNVHKFPQENPFTDEGEEVGSALYRYRKWDIGGGNTLVARCTVDGAYKSSSGDVQYMTLKALNDYRSSGEWTQKLDTQPGAVLASELKKNSNKLARWTISALLADTQHLKLGYVTRTNPKDKTKHAILGVQSYRPVEFASQILLNIHNSWGILRAMIDQCLAQPQGKYLILKDPNVQSLHLYKIPMDAFEEDSE